MEPRRFTSWLADGRRKAGISLTVIGNSVILLKRSEPSDRRTSGQFLPSVFPTANNTRSHTLSRSNRATVKMRKMREEKDMKKG